MSSTQASKIDSIKTWLGKNAFWRDELIIKPSKYGGIGVFAPDDMDYEDPLLLRIPKTSVLTPKNSLIYNLLIDYKYRDVDISIGMYGVIISVIYEISAGTKSPWSDYLDSIDFETSSVPVCLWSQEDKENLKNTEVDLLNLLDPAELIQFYQECLSFAEACSKYIEIPSILAREKEDGDVSVQSPRLYKFGQIIVSVISRAFKIDDYFDLGMVPGADLFNHMEPDINGKSIVGRENIHFICDGSVCSECGEEICDHEEDSDMELDSDTEEIEDDVIEGEDAANITGEEGDLDEVLGDSIVDESGEEPASESDVSSEDSEPEISQNDVEQESDEEQEEEPITEITMDYIKQMEHDMENGSDAETDQDPDEESTVSLEADEAQEEQSDDEDGTVDADQEELAQELSDSSKCCDVVLMKLPEAEHDNEIFNSYGNDLSNPYLLQRYGFITNPNVSDTCLLSVQVFKHIKQIKSGLSSDKQKHFDLKFEWFEGMGFDILNQLIAEQIQREQSEANSCGAECEDNCQDDCEKKDGCGDNCEDVCDDGCGDDNDDELDLPETWQLSPRITYSGECTLQTYAILILLDLPFKIFKHRLLLVNKEKKLIKSIKEIFLEDKSSRAAQDGIVKKWCTEKLSKYTELKPSPHYELIKDMIQQEKSILLKFLKN